MDFGLTEEQRLLERSIAEIAGDYGEEYWREHHDPGAFPRELWDELADGGWTGASVPEAYGGRGLGVLETALMAEELAEKGAWRIFPPLSRNTLGASALEAYGSDEQKEALLPATARGEIFWCQAFTEPDAGLNLPNIATNARRDGDEWVLDGGKVWIGGAKLADYGIVLARTTPVSELEDPTRGLALFIVPMDRDGIALQEMDVDSYFPTPVYEFHLDEVRVGADRLLFGGADERFTELFHVMNHERITFSAFITGCGYYALERAAAYANEREVFGAPIGSHQAIQHPLADAYADVELASTYVKRAAWQYDRGESAGEVANVAMLKSAEAAWDACEAAMDTFGGSSIDADLGIGALWQTIRHLRIIPVTEQMIRNYIAERALGLPKSY